MLLLLGACTSIKEEMAFPDFGEEEELTGDTLACREIIALDFLLLKGKSLFVASTRSDTVLWKYALPDMTLQCRWGIRGQGKDEFSLFPMFCRNFTDTLFVWGYTPVTIKGFIADEGRMKSAREFKLRQYESFNQMHILHDSLLIYSTIPSEFAIKKINLNTGNQSGQIDIEQDDHQETFFYTNKGIMSANEDYIVYAYCYKKQIDIYRVSDMKLCRRLVDRDVRPEIRIGNLQDTKFRYVNVLAGRKYIYALYKETNEEYWMEVIDYKGEKMRKYRFDIPPLLFDVDEESGVLYGFNEDLESYFLRYNLGQL